MPRYDPAKSQNSNGGIFEGAFGERWMQYWGKIHQGRPLRHGNRWRLSPRPRGGNQTFGSRLSLVCPFLLCAAGLEAGVRELGISRKSSIELNGGGKVLKSGCSRRNDCSDAVAVVGCIGRSVTVAIMVCSNHMNFQDEVNQVVVHELIHAYDDCRAANLDWANCAHHACSEIRAGHLSGDCHYKRELLRGFVKIQGHEQDCVRRRVMKSVIANPYCSEAAAKDAMEAVWDVCYNDTKPFDRAP
ncbi:unnamed protein product [Camellia sinensis]